MSLNSILGLLHKVPLQTRESKICKFFKTIFDLQGFKTDVEISVKFPKPANSILSRKKDKLLTIAPKVVFRRVVEN